MPVPKRKKSKANSRQGRAHQSLSAPTLVACRQCHEKIPPHRVCPHCGHYKGREVVRQEIK